MHWYEKAQNPEALTTLFSAPPQLDKLRFLGVHLSSRNRSASVFFELAKFPDHPPQRWKNKNFTGAEVQVDFFSIDEFTVLNGELDEIITVEVQSKTGDRMSFVAKGAHAQTHFTFLVFRIAHLVGK